jgi:hypothetical protein
MCTEATPVSIAERIMDPVSVNHKGVIPPGRLSLCPKDVKNIETSLKISNSIEILGPFEMRQFPRNFFIFCALRLSAASCTR